MPRKKKAKYNKIKIETWKCDSCNFVWNYRSLRCPLCSSEAKTLITA